jgi:hypothetical protein
LIQFKALPQATMAAKASVDKGVHKAPNVDKAVHAVCPCCRAKLALIDGQLSKVRSRAEYKRDHEKKRRKA